MPRTINYDQIRSKIVSSKRVRDLMDSRVRARVDDAKRELIDSFLEHKVSQELMDPSKGNISRTLDGKDNKSLFGFIGFEAGSEPVLEVAAMLENQTRLVEGAKIVANNKIQYKIQHPSLKELYAKTPLPFEGGRSWLYGISHGISGFGHFLAGLFGNLSISRSGQGIQIKDHEVRSGTFKPRKDYIEVMIAKFRAKFGK